MRPSGRLHTHTYMWVYVVYIAQCGTHTHMTLVSYVSIVIVTKIVMSRKRDYAKNAM